MAPAKQKHLVKVEQRRRLTLFFNKEARRSAAEALKKASWMLAAANAYLGFTKDSLAYLAILIVGWLVAQTLAVILLSIEEGLERAGGAKRWTCCSTTSYAQ